MGDTKKGQMGMMLKGAQVSTLTADSKELAKINKFTLEPLTEADVFVYRVAMCDNAVDRDWEHFPQKALKKMQKLFIGKTMIKDHLHRADNQVARIYDTELVYSEKEITDKGEVYTQLVANCYMLNTDSNKDLIAEIKAGIKKEVSVGLKVGKAVCSVCGTDNMKSYCNHWHGKTYDGELCTFSLEEPVDAYEVSFVAVPAQPRSGAMKAYGESLKEYEPISEPEQPETKSIDEALELEMKLKSLGAFLFAQNLID